MPNKRELPEKRTGAEKKNMRHKEEIQELGVNRTTTRTSTERSGHIKA